MKTHFASFPLVIATVVEVSRKRGLWLVVRVKKETPRVSPLLSFSSAASYVGMIQIRYAGLGDKPTLSPDPSGSRSVYFLFSDKTYYILSARKSQVAPVSYMLSRLRISHGSIDIFSCIPCSLLTALCSPPIAFSRRPFRNFLSCLFPSPVLQSKSVNGMQYEERLMLRSIQLLDDEDQIAGSPCSGLRGSQKGSTVPCHGSMSAASSAFCLKVILRHAAESMPFSLSACFFRIHGS